MKMKLNMNMMKRGWWHHSTEGKAGFHPYLAGKNVSIHEHTKRREQKGGGRK
jgi:hypothetical protein